MSLKIFLSFLIVSVVSITGVFAFNNINQKVANANYSITKSNTSDSWLAITNANPQRVEGYFCARREYLIENEEPIELTAFVEGNKVGNMVDNNYNSMNPFESNCDPQDRNDFYFDLEYSKNCQYDDILIAVKSKVYNQTNVVKKFIDNPYCNNNINNNISTNNNFNSNYNNQSTYNNSNYINQNSTISGNNQNVYQNSNSYSNNYLNVNNCVNGSNYRIAVFGISNNSNDYQKCSGLSDSYVSSTKLDKRYLHVAICSDNASNLELGYITRIDSSNNTFNLDLCFVDQSQVEYYTVDLQNDNYLTVSECVKNNDSFDIFTSIVSSQNYKNNFENCTEFYNNRSSNYNYILNI